MNDEIVDTFHDYDKHKLLQKFRNDTFEAIEMGISTNPVLNSFQKTVNEFNIDFSIDAFYSKTRNHSSYISLKGFDEQWNKAKFKIGGIQPSGYTRIGAALRHSGHLLEQRSTKNKWVILLSDGKPNDYDKYEGKYGINDVKQALRELNERQINSYALAIEAQAKYYLPQMFGQNHYQILTTPVELLQSLVQLYEKIKHQS